MEQRWSDLKAMVASARLLENSKSNQCHEYISGSDGDTKLIFDRSAQ